MGIKTWAIKKWKKCKSFEMSDVIIRTFLSKFDRPERFFHFNLTSDWSDILHWGSGASVLKNTLKFALFYRKDDVFSMHPLSFFLPSTMVSICFSFAWLWSCWTQLTVYCDAAEFITWVSRVVHWHLHAIYVSLLCTCKMLKIPFNFLFSISINCFGCSLRIRVTPFEWNSKSRAVPCETVL